MTSTIRTFTEYWAISTQGQHCISNIRYNIRTHITKQNQEVSDAVQSPTSSHKSGPKCLLRLLARGKDALDKCVSILYLCLWIKCKQQIKSETEHSKTGWLNSFRFEFSFIFLPNHQGTKAGSASKWIEKNAQWIRNPVLRRIQEVGDWIEKTNPHILRLLERPYTRGRRDWLDNVDLTFGSGLHSQDTQDWNLKKQIEQRTCFCFSPKKHVQRLSLQQKHLSKCSSGLQPNWPVAAKL